MTIAIVALLVILTAHVWWLESRIKKLERAQRRGASLAPIVATFEIDTSDVDAKVKALVDTLDGISKTSRAY